MNFLLPEIAHAAPALPPAVLTFIGNVYEEILNPIIAFMFVVATVYFIYGVVQYVWQPDNEEAREKGKRAMLWGVVGFVIMTSVFGIMWIIIRTIGADPGLMRYV